MSAETAKPSDDSTRSKEMSQIAPDVIASVERFLAVVRRRLRVDAAYLYGSQAMGSARPWSDIDVAIISADFSDDLFQARIALMQWAAEIDDRIEPQPFTPDRFGPNDPLASEISRNGVQLV
jgi:predicted nucleotidyltransferase